MEDLQLALQSSGSLDRFRKAAVMAEAGWVENLAKIGGKLLPQTQTEVFGTDQQDEALRWATA